MSAAASQAYAEPSHVALLVLSSFLVLLNAVRVALDRLCGIGLLGELALGAIYGTPLGGILSDVEQQAFVSLGYVGLLLIVFHGALAFVSQLIRQAA